MYHSHARFQPFTVARRGAQPERAQKKTLDSMAINGPFLGEATADTMVAAPYIPDLLVRVIKRRKFKKDTYNKSIADSK
jgi:hypothetical protein